MNFYKSVIGSRDLLIYSKKILKLLGQKDFASSGNRTRAARVAGEHSTTEPTMLRWKASLPSRNTFQRQHAHAVAELNFQPFSFFSLHSLLFQLSLIHNDETELFKRQEYNICHN